jgi:hypothetical protein
MKISIKEYLPLSLLGTVLLLSGCTSDAQMATGARTSRDSCISSCWTKYECVGIGGVREPKGMDCFNNQNECIAECSPKGANGISLVQPDSGTLHTNDAASTTAAVKMTPLPTSAMNDIPAAKKSIVYGAIAYDRASGAWGLADSYPDKKRADISALYYCGKHGNDCRIVSRFANACAAVMSGKNNIVTWGTAATAEAAQKEAQQKCAKNAGGSCVVQFAHCYF